MTNEGYKRWHIFSCFLEPGLKLSQSQAPSYFCPQIHSQQTFDLHILQETEVFRAPHVPAKPPHLPLSSPLPPFVLLGDPAGSNPDQLRIPPPAAVLLSDPADWQQLDQLRVPSCCRPAG